MSDNVRLWMFGGALLGLALLTGMCAQDWRSAQQQIRDAVIVGGSYSPGHYTEDCSGTGRLNKCTTDWVAPTWSLRYTDEAGIHTADVDEKTYTSLQTGQPVTVTFWEGGLLGIRYGEEIRPLER